MSDYIERDELIKHIKDLPAWWADNSVTCAFYLTKAITEIENAPAADVQAIKRGKWKLCYEDRRMQIAGDECSARGFQHYGACISHYHYCPNCGAKMEDASNAER